jgi:hypothetical protein
MTVPNNTELPCATATLPARQETSARLLAVKVRTAGWEPRMAFHLSLFIRPGRRMDEQLQ